MGSFNCASMNQADIARIIVELPLSTIFSYKIPEKLIPSIQTGVKVLIPFGPRKIVGYVIGTSNEIEPEIEDKLKEIIEVLDEVPVINERLIDLTRWIAEYYLAPWGEVIKTALPKVLGRTKPKLEKFLSLSKSFSDNEIKEKFSRSPVKEKLIRLLLGKKEVSYKKLNCEIKNLSNAARFLEEKQIIKISYRETNRNPLSHIEEDQSQKAPQKLLEGQDKAFKEILNGIEAGGHKVYLLHGITGSGKTEVYMQAISETLSRGKEAIFLVPEIAITPQLIQRLKARFGNKVALLHSTLSGGERYDEWRRIRDGKAKVAVGPRSAIFAPFPNPGIIIVDEEHEYSYKQDESPCYHARDTAIKLAEISDSIVILGSATPSLESYYHAKKGKYVYLSLPERAGNRPLPEMEIVDMRVRNTNIPKRTAISKILKEEIEKRLLKKEQVFLFLNRRGTASFLQCRECGYTFYCRNCSVSLTFHAADSLNRCHYCDYHVLVPDVCPECKGIKISFSGIGTQKIEEDCLRLFPKTRVFRMDKDSTRTKNAYYHIFKKVKDREIDILIGTQMIAKGHDFPFVTLVGVVAADLSLNIPDFRSGERTFQLITQVAGRSGRGDLAGKAIIQTYNPNHDILRHGKNNDYNKFALREIEWRERLGYPPYTKMVGIKLGSSEEEAVKDIAVKFGKSLKKIVGKKRKGKAEYNLVDFLGPARSLLYKIKNVYRWQIILKGPSMDSLKEIIQKMKKEFNKSLLKKARVKIKYDIDPVNLM